MKTEGHAGLVILVHTPVIYMFTPQPPTPTKSVSHLSSLSTHFYALISICATVCVCGLCVCLCAVCGPMCMYVWLGLLIPPARKCPAARIWSWESVRCSVDMWHGAKTGTQPLSISMVQYCPTTATALPETGGDCWEKLHIAKNKFEVLQTETCNCQKLVQNAKNNKNNNQEVITGIIAAHASLAKLHEGLCSLLANN